jgi:hypothetical protein
MNFFNKEPVKRLNEEELREDYIGSKKLDKQMSFIVMIVLFLLSILIICFSVIKEIYWVLSFSIITIILFIYFMNSFSRLIEDIFENRVIE